MRSVLADVFDNRAAVAIFLETLTALELAVLRHDAVRLNDQATLRVIDAEFTRRVEARTR